MKILMVSMASLHFFRWTEQLKDSGHEVYWFDILDSGTPSERIPWVHQIVGWKRRLDFPGRYWLKNKSPRIYRFIEKINNRNTAKSFEKIILQVKPDVVHSFALYVSCAPILEVMKKYKSIKWVYSSWGSDLFARKNNVEDLQIIKNVLPFINFMFTDCKRDYNIALELGFKGMYLGNYPGGGGYNLKLLEKKMLPFNERNIILIKGYEGKHGRIKMVLDALPSLKNKLINYNLVVFGANQEVIDFVSNSDLCKWDNFTINRKISHDELMSYYGKSVIYIGNSLSDGIPNTLLEAIVMGVFPIQSNPGKATGELITDRLNGLLLNEEESIKKVLEYSLSNIDLKEAIEYNNLYLRPNYDFFKIQKEVLNCYLNIENNI